MIEPGSSVPGASPGNPEGFASQGFDTLGQQAAPGMVENQQATPPTEAVGQQAEAPTSWYPETPAAPDTPGAFAARWDQLRGSLADVRASLPTGREAVGAAVTVLAPVVGTAAMRGINNMVDNNPSVGNRVLGGVAKVGVTVGLNKLRTATDTWVNSPR
jgi:hypothetical protein